MHDLEERLKHYNAGSYINYNYKYTCITYNKNDKKKFTHYYKSIELEMIGNFLIYLLIKSLKLSIQQFK